MICSETGDGITLRQIDSRVLDPLIALWNQTPEPKLPMESDKPLAGSVADFWRERYDETARVVHRQHEQMSKEIQGLRAELGQADRWGKACASELEKVKAERDLAREVNNDYAATVGNLRGQLRETTAERDALISERTTLRADNMQLAESREDMKRQLREATREAQEAVDAKANPGPFKREWIVNSATWSDQEPERLAEHLANPDEPLVEIALVQEWISELDSDSDARHLLGKLLDYMLEGSGPITPTYAITDKDVDETPF